MGFGGEVGAWVEEWGVDVGVRRCRHVWLGVNGGR